MPCRTWHIYCSQQCRDGKKKPHEVICNSCSKLFLSALLNRKFCSKGCKYKFEHPSKPSIHRLCEGCSKEFSVSSHHTTRHMFCSSKCRSKAKYSAPPNIKSCVVCSTTFIVQGALKQKTCSKACRTIHKNKTTKIWIKNNPQFIQDNRVRTRERYHIKKQVPGFLLHKRKVAKQYRSTPEVRNKLNADSRRRSRIMALDPNWFDKKSLYLRQREEKLAVAKQTVALLGVHIDKSTALKLIESLTGGPL